MEMDSVAHKGYEIEPRVWPLVDGTFGISANIWEHTGPKSVMHKVDARNTYETDEKARVMAIELGRQAIDGELAGISVP